MFELQRLQGAPPPGIALQTRAGRDIQNSLGVTLTEVHSRRYNGFVKKHGHRWKQRKPPSGAYNCAGHVWASRRACIYEPTDWEKILVDDGYRETRSPMPDDLVIYSDQDGEILHIARVLELREGLTDESSDYPWVVSKWADWGGESCHFVHDHPLNAPGFTVSTNYWTDRPRNRE